MKPAIEKSVGRGGKNLPIDVAVIQALIDEYYGLLRTQFGTADSTLSDSIEDFQKSEMKTAKPSGRIDPGSRTLSRLSGHKDVRHQRGTTRQIVFGKSVSNSADLLRRVEASRFADLFKGHFPHLTSKPNLIRFMGYVLKDPKMTDLRYAAYAITLVFHETRHTFAADIDELGKGFYKKNGVRVARPYAKHVTASVTHADGTKGSVAHAYYGRGWSQLTWASGYRKAGKYLGMGDQLVIDPELVKRPEIGYGVLSYLLFGRTKTIKDFIQGSKTNYVGARGLVNLNDKAEYLARIARKAEVLLHLSARPAPKPTSSSRPADYSCTDHPVAS